MPATVIANNPVGYMLEVQIANDPFTSYVDTRQLSLTQPKKEKPVMAKTTAKELRKQAKALDIEGWEDMDRDELAAAIEEAGGAEEEEAEEEVSPRVAKAMKAAGRTKVKKSPASKKAAAGKKTAPAKKAAKSKKSADEDDEPTGPNPFREGTNLWHMTEQLMAGGKRSAMVKKLLKKIELNPRTKGGKDFDPAEEIDYRLVRVCQLLANEYGFEINKDGRGKDQQVTAIPPE